METWLGKVSEKSMFSALAEVDPSLRLDRGEQRGGVGALDGVGAEPVDARRERVVGWGRAARAAQSAAWSTAAAQSAGMRTKPRSYLARAAAV